MKDERKELALLVDLSKLIKKHGIDSFEKLSDLLSKSEFNQQLAEILSKTAKASRKTKRKVSKTRTSTQKRKFKDSLFILKETESERAELLISLYNELQSKAYLPTLKDIRNHLSDSDLPELKATSREKALIPFVKLFLDMPLEKLKENIDNLKYISMNKGDRSLEGWSDIIFKKSTNKTNLS